ncbi:MAG: VWA domain-containing protein [Candidatus Aureabacteria bacterium]|nr:VWA domain-containing protein [Candidatus Auribacterota bacterium]
MNDQKYIFSLVVTFSLLFHVSFLIASKHIIVSPGGKIEQDIKRTFRMRNITFLREIKDIKPVEEIRKIQFPDMTKDLIQKAQDLVFDGTPYDKESINSDENIYVSRKLEKEFNFYEFVEETPEVLRAIDAHAKENIMISKKRSFVQNRDNSAINVKDEIAGIENRARRNISGENQTSYLMPRYQNFESDFGLESGIASKKQKEDISGEELDINDIEDTLLSKSTDIENVVIVDNLDDFIDVNISHAFSEEDAGYFKIQLKMKHMYTGIKTFPKDVIFVIDISRSMEDEQVAKITNTIKNIISKDLEQDDRFNIVLFSQVNKVFSDTLVTCGITKRKDELNAFFRNVLTQGQTDVYGSLSQIMSLWSTEKNRAGILVLITDGRSTKGVKDPEEVIKKITKINNAKWRIYCFGNERADSYLLDMLSYMNRGYSLYAKNFIRVDDELRRLFEEIKDPVVLNVKFQHTGRGIEGIYPLVIPDLFENGKIVFYGKYQDKDSVFSGRILGNTVHGEKEIVFIKEFKDIPETIEKDFLKKNFEMLKKFESQKPEIY